MANLDHEAIRKAYPDVVNIDDGAGAFKEDGTKINLVQSDIDAARVELDKLKYRKDRSFEYPEITDQLDMIYHDQVNGTTTFKDAIKAVKDKYPKPS